MFSENTDKEHFHLNKCWWKVMASHTTVQNEVMVTEWSEILQTRQGRKRRRLGKDNDDMEPVSYGVNLLRRPCPAHQNPYSPKAEGRQSLSFYNWSLIILWACVWTGWKCNTCHKTSIKYFMPLVKDVVGSESLLLFCSLELKGRRELRQGWNQVEI